MRRTFIITLALTAGSIALAQPDRSGFHRGHIYVSEIWEEGCWVGAPQYVREIDPVSGQSWIFADISDGLCDPTGLVFTPDWGRLRVANFSTDEIFDFDTAGKHTVKYTWRDGLSGSGNYNGMAFDSNGNFFVTSQYSGDLLKFPSDTAPGSVFADQVWQACIRFHPDGRLFVCSVGGLVMWVFEPDGSRATFELLPPAWSFHSIAISSAGDLYAGISFSNTHDPPTSWIYKYDGAEPGAKRVITEIGRAGHGYTLALSANERELYVSQSYDPSILGVDLETAAVRTVFTFPYPSGSTVGLGMAVYAPPIPPFAPGDLNCDGSVNPFDINPFILALSDAGTYAQTFPTCDVRLADTNADGSINQFDIQGFVELLTP